MTDKPTRYKLKVNLSIEKEEWNGPLPINDQAGYWNSSFGNEHLTISEDVALGSMSFTDLTHVLITLHDAVQLAKPVDKTQTSN